MRFVQSIVFLGVTVGIALTGAAQSGASNDFRSATTVAYSIRSTNSDLIVAVSPVRQTLAMGGTTGALLGASIDAVANDRYRKTIAEILTDYDPETVFVQAVEKALAENTDAALVRVSPMGSAAKYDSVREAEAARFKALADDGAQYLLDIQITFGLYGVEGVIVTKLDGELYTLPKGSRVWNETTVVIPEPILGPNKLKDPTKRLAPNFTSPNLKADKDAVARWTEDGGEEFRQRYKSAVDGAVAGLLTSLELKKSALGEYYLGKVALQRKKFDQARARFTEAIRLDSENVDARNGLIVTMGHDKDEVEAMQMAMHLVQERPDFAPGWLNLAWLQVIKLKHAELGREPYERALSLGMAPVKSIAKKLD